MVIERRMKNGDYVSPGPADDVPRMFIFSNYVRVFLAKFKLDVRDSFEWPIPKPPPGQSFAIVAMPTSKQLKDGCTCPGIRHNKSNTACVLNPALMDGKEAGARDEPNVYTTAGDLVGRLIITKRQSGILRRIRLVTYSALDETIRP